MNSRAPQKYIATLALAPLCAMACAQVNIDSSEFPLIGTSYLVSNVAFVNAPPAAAGGPGQYYDFTGGFTYGGQLLIYKDAALNPFAAEFPTATLSRFVPGDMKQYHYYDKDVSGFWQEGMAWVGYILDTNKIDTLFFHNQPPGEDTLLSDQYEYGYADSTYALSELSVLIGFTPVNIYYHLYKRIDADGWGTMETGYGVYDSVLRVHVTEYKYDSIFVFGNFDNATLDTVDYFLYYKKGVRYPLVKEITEPFMEVNGPDTTLYFVTEILNVPPDPPVIFGCTDTAAVNYNPMAMQDDGSCVVCAPIAFTLTPDAYICEGDSLALTATGGASYSWSTGDNTASIVVNPLTTTTYSVLINSTTYCWEQASVVVGVYNEVVAGFWTGPAIIGDSTTFVNLSAAATSYFWDFGDGATSGEEDPVHYYDSLGTYSVMLIASNPCSVDSFVGILDVVTGLPETGNEAGGLKVIPNPVVNSAKVAFSLGEAQTAGLFVVDVLGRRTPVFSGRRLSAGDHEFDLSELVRRQPAGVYFIVLQSNLGQTKSKWIRQ